MFSFRLSSATALAALLLGVALLPPLSASAATPALSVTAVNMRAGPSTSYPVVVTLPARADLSLYGCTADTAWCDVGWGVDRGWVAAGYLQINHHGGVTLVTPVVAPAAGVSVVVFNQTYWQAHYVGRPWYGNWHSYPGPVGAAAGCNGKACGAVIVRPGHVAAGGCANGECKGVSVKRGPLGNIRIRHGSTSRD